METIAKGVYFGIDISDKYTLVSYYNDRMKEPMTVSTVMGGENFVIPTMLAKKKGMSQWFFGDEARRRVNTGEATAIENLFQRALLKEKYIVEGELYEARDLLVIFFKKIFTMPGQPFTTAPLERLTLCMESSNLEIMELFSYVTKGLGIDSHKVAMIDYREAFYYYVFNQEPHLYQYDVALFDNDGSKLVSHILRRNQNTRPQLITIDSTNHGKLADNRDEAFDEIIANDFGNDMISSVYLCGEGFDGDWMKVSLARICKGRKAFIGKNLYSKGACYAGFIRAAKRDWPFYYQGDNELKLNLSLKVLEDNELKFFSLIDAGESWYEASGECEIILDGEPEIEFWIQRPESREASVEVLELTDFPERENRTSRLRISAKAKSDRTIEIKIKDLGFGELFPSSGRSWEHMISIATKTQSEES